jgi:hypothetical protein
VSGAASPTSGAAPGEQPGRTPPAQRLAATGTPTSTLLGYGSLLILAGAGLLAAPTLGRWRRRTPGPAGSEPTPSGSETH